MVRDGRETADGCTAAGAEVEVDTVSGHITITPHVAGGKPRIAGHRIKVQDIVLWHERFDMSADEIAAEYDLSLADVYAALAYYYDHRDEIDRSIQSDDAFVTELRQRIPSKLRARLSG
jgi:uncharacterized protein (DUF433 family)